MTNTTNKPHPSRPLAHMTRKDAERNHTSDQLRHQVKELRNTEPNICTGVEASSIKKDEAALILTGHAYGLAEARAILGTAPAPTAPAPAPATSVQAGDLADVLASALSGRISAGIDEDAVKQIVRDELANATVEADPDDIRQQITDILDTLANSASPTLKRAKVAIASTSTNPITRALHRFVNPTAPNRPLMIAGRAGTGKTTGARAHGKLFSVCYEYQCAKEHRLPQLLGKDIPVPENGALGFAWTDSPIAAAFRTAASGEKVLLIIDEIFRLTSGVRNTLLSALAPTLDGHYRLNTGRVLSVVNGIAETETIEAPVENLGIVATTNVGGQYRLEESCPAMAERWKYLYIDTDWNAATEILENAARAYGWTDPAGLASALRAIGEATEQLQASNELWHVATLRTLSRALRSATPNKTGDLHCWLLDEADNWTNKDADGRPNATQRQQIDTLIQNTLNA